MSPWLTKTAKSQLSPLEMFPNNPTDLLPFVQTDIDLNSKVKFDFVASNVVVCSDVVMLVVGWPT